VFRSDGGAWAPIAELAVDAGGRVAYEDRSVVAGGRCGYRLVSVGATGGEVWVTVPGATLALEGARPNPAAGAPMAAFSLPDAAPAELALLDVTGRVLATREVGALGAGRHVVAIGDGAELRPGVYWLRLTRGAETRIGKAAVGR
jgi:hypothetical protein